MNRQEAFDLVVERLLDGKGQCINPSELPDIAGCVYDNGQGNHCAIGYLFHKSGINIPKTRNGNSLGYLSEKGQIPKKADWLIKDFEFYVRLQLLHDDKDNWKDNKFIVWGKVKDLADCYGLTTGS